MTTTTKIAQIGVMCFGLVTVGAAWSCQEDAAAANAARPDAAQAQAPASVAESQPSALSGARLYAVFHDPALNNPDGLANYAEDYRAAYPN